MDRSESDRQLNQTSISMADEMIEIDGSQGEGGGQVLRTSLALSVCTGRPLRIENIRAGRPKPGLMRQHLTAVRAAAAISDATVSGDAIGSRRLTFEPQTIRPGEYEFRIGTAGSTTLMLQTILPPLLTADGPSTIRLEGGTHNPHAPPFDFLARAFLPLIERMGPRVAAELERPGFYPAGGGRLRVRIDPASRLAPLHLPGRGEVRSRICRGVVSSLPGDIVTRELAVLRERLAWPDECFEHRQLPPGHGPGNVLTVEIESEHVCEVFTGFGERGVRAETVAQRVLDEVEEYLAAGVPVGRRLADQLLLPLALSAAHGTDGGGSFVTLPLTRHATTNIDVIRRFLDVEIASAGIGRDRVLVRVDRTPPA